MKLNEPPIVLSQSKGNAQHRNNPLRTKATQFSLTFTEMLSIVILREVFWNFGTENFPT